MGANQSQEQMLGPGPHVIYCKTCKENKLSKIEYVNGSTGWVFCVLLSLAWISVAIILFDLLSKNFTWDKFFEMSAYLLFLGLVFTPFCILPLVCNNCKDRKHYCTQCDTYIGKCQAGNRQNNQVTYMYM